MSSWIQNFPTRLSNKLNTYWLRFRDVEIQQGYAKGLLFRTGSGNPEYGLGINEIPVQEILVDLLKPGLVFYDIGANVGFFSMIAAKYLDPNGGVYAFEPLPENAKAIQHNVSINNFLQVEVIQKAVSNHSGKEQLLVSDFSGGSSLESGDRPPDLVGEIEVDVVTIDDFIISENASPPDVVKIDVEGVEINVLEGMKETIAEFRPVVIYEIDDDKQENYDRKEKACEQYLLTCGYSIEKLGEGYPGNAWIVGHYIARPNN